MSANLVSIRPRPDLLGKYWFRSRAAAVGEELTHPHAKVCVRLMYWVRKECGLNDASLQQMRLNTERTRANHSIVPTDEWLAKTVGTSPARRFGVVGVMASRQGGIVGWCLSGNRALQLAGPTMAASLPMQPSWSGYARRGRRNVTI